MATYEESQELRELAAKLISTREDVGHVEIDDVLFLTEKEITKPRALACCYSFGDHPVSFFTPRSYCIVVYDCVTDHMSRNQKALLLLHELMHIPEKGSKLVNHDIQDFHRILSIGGIDWTEEGAEVPDILEG